jgi:hypothetical protein
MYQFLSHKLKSSSLLGTIEYRSTIVSLNEILRRSYIFSRVYLDCQRKLPF